MPSEKIVSTGDGSHSLFSNKFEEHYHSSFGAIQESKHVFINSGLNAYKNKSNEINLLEIGFGTGLNALLAMRWAEENKVNVNYFGVEAYPISLSVVQQLNYPELLKTQKEVFLRMHEERKTNANISPYFHFTLSHQLIEKCSLPAGYFNVIFYDAFSPVVQPEMWVDGIFRKIAEAAVPGAILTTYSSKGLVKRALKSVGFSIQKLPGPPGKREILKAVLNG
jgi:tRNA U34 5-methylaminomethyl-2-thiouridine-forming methyltransferase MnmC